MVLQLRRGAVHPVGIENSHPASFRDPSGVVFRAEDGTLYRQVNRVYERDYRRLMDSGLYERLVSEGMLIEHHEVDRSLAIDGSAYCVIQPCPIPMISYPYEWCFTALKNAALLTLQIQKCALDYGMSLKDASAFNVQFIGTTPVLIDTLSFEEYEDGHPWVAYGQFCRHFLAPLALMSKVDMRLNRLASVHLDGIPLDIASRMLPLSSRFRFGLSMHLHLQARFVKAYSDTSKAADVDVTQRKLAKGKQLALLENLVNTVQKLHIGKRRTEWADYYQDHSYSHEAFEQKRTIVKDFIERVGPQTVWDLGANTGEFSRIAAQSGARVYAFDVDPACVEAGFRYCLESGIQNLLPLCMDLTNPSPALGWAQMERQSLTERGPADLVLSLALVHHLAISNNVPFELIVQYLHQLSRNLIIEFVPKSDPQVKRLLRSRKDIFDHYSQEYFEAAFQRQYAILDRTQVGEDGRLLYLMTSDNTCA